ncbi:MAG: hypothetical protein KGL99_19260 [Burkholderiales bacterium]|nr:hypothetical protein [Burkholderiales bacterium]MDE2629289.1 hypothetical protein [Burkholderiales bacterium]
MRFNAVPFLFLPGLVLAGYLLGRWSGVGWSLVAWSTAVLIGTVIHVMRRSHEMRHRGRRPDDDAASSGLPHPKT